MKQTTVLAPVIDLKRGGSSDDRQITDTPPHAAAGLKVCPIQRTWSSERIGIDKILLMSVPLSHLLTGLSLDRYPYCIQFNVLSGKMKGYTG